MSATDGGIRGVFSFERCDKTKRYLVQLEVRIAETDAAALLAIGFADYKCATIIGGQRYVILNPTFSISAMHKKRAVDMAFQQAARRYVRVMRDCKLLKCEAVDDTTGEILGEGRMN